MKYLNEYLLGSTIHGFRYLSGTERSCTRLIWLGVLFVQVTLVVIFMKNFVVDWSTNQVVRLNLIIKVRYMFKFRTSVESRKGLFRMREYISKSIMPSGVNIMSLFYNSRQVCAF